MSAVSRCHLRAVNPAGARGRGEPGSRSQERNPALSLSKGGCEASAMAPWFDKLTTGVGAERLGSVYFAGCPAGAKFRDDNLGATP
jgi:hypothetical protein